MKKVLNIVKNVLVWTIVAFAVFVMIFTVISVSTFNKNDRKLFGYGAYVVKTDSMAATDFAAGSLIFVKEVNPKELKEGDIIAFISQDSDSYGETITHKIRMKTTDAEGNPGFVTYGTTTNNDDDTIVTYPYIIGKYTGHINGIGHFFNFLRTTPGYIVCIGVPFMLLILYHGVKTITLFKKYKQEQNAKIKAEREKIEQEREANAKMLEELQALKAQLENQGVTPPAAQTQPPEDKPAETDGGEENNG